MRENNWINKEDQLPEKNGKVLVYDEDSLTPEKILMYENGRFYFEAYGVRLYYTNTVSKWKPYKETCLCHTEQFKSECTKKCNKK